VTGAVRGFPADSRGGICSGRRRKPAVERYQKLSVCRCFSGSDGTRTRDLRRDRPVCGSCCAVACLNYLAFTVHEVLLRHAAAPLALVNRLQPMARSRSSRLLTFVNQVE
jgi:hypothetical protein